MSKIILKKSEQIDSKLDPEMIDAIDALNEIDGIETFDSCFGHPASGKTCNHHSNFFIGLFDKDKDLFNKFWISFFKKYPTKTDTPTGWVQFSLIEYLFTSSRYRLRLKCAPEHDPAIDPRGNQEKIYGLNLLIDFCNHWNKNEI